jgi:hypothetical protein
MASAAVRPHVQPIVTRSRIRADIAKATRLAPERDRRFECATLIRPRHTSDLFASGAEPLRLNSVRRNRGRRLSRLIARTVLEVMLQFDRRETAVACLLFTCPKTSRKLSTGVEMDVQGLRAHWKLTLNLDCPHCGAVHAVCVREVYLSGAVERLELMLYANDADHTRPDGLRGPQRARVSMGGL